MLVDQSDDKLKKGSLHFPPI